jgi:putative flippase GtrA/aryl carrier-like protein
MVRFVISGGTATLVNLATLYVLTHFLGIWYLYSSILAFAASFFVSFSLQKFWTFGENSHDRMQAQATLFLGVMLFALSLNTVLIYIFVELANAHYLLGQLASGILIAFVNYFSYKHVVFSEKKFEARSWDRPTWLQVIFIAGTIALFAFLSLYHLSENPPTWLDEGTNIQVAMNIAEHGINAVEIAPGRFISSDFTTTSFTVTYPIALAFNLIETNILIARSVMVAFMALTLLFTYLLISSLSGAKKYTIALSSLLLLTTFAPLYGHGKNLLGEVPGLMFFLAALYFLRKAEQLSSWKLFVIAGIAAGLSIATKPLYMLVLAPALLIFVLLKLRSIPLRSILALLLSAGTVLIAWFFIHLGHINGLKEVLFAANAEDASLTARLLRTSSQFLTELQPMYFLGLLSIWLLSLLARWRRRITIDSAELLAVLFALVNLGLYLVSRGFYRYFFPAEVLALIFLPLALLTFPVRERNRKITRFVGVGVISLLIPFQTYQTFFSSWIAQSRSSTRSSELAEHLGTLPEGSSLFLYNVPEAAIFFPSRNYYQYLNYGEKVIRGEENLPLLFSGEPDFVLVDQKFTAQDRLLPSYEESARFDKYTLYRKVEK